VSTKGAQQAQRRQGRVVDQIDVNGRKVWLVDFDGTNNSEPMRPQQLLVVDAIHQEYAWILVNVSEPEDSTEPKEYADGIGLAGFDFAKTFSPPDGRAYDFPHLTLASPGNVARGLEGTTSASESKDCP
jgi:hypothetical protein